MEVDVSDPEWKKIIQWHMDHKCAEPDCRNYAENGYVYCGIHLYGAPRHIEDRWFELYDRLRLLEGL